MPNSTQRSCSISFFTTQRPLRTDRSNSFIFKRICSVLSFIDALYLSCDWLRFLSAVTTSLSSLTNSSPPPPGAKLSWLAPMASANNSASPTRALKPRAGFLFFGFSIPGSSHRVILPYKREVIPVWLYSFYPALLYSFRFPWF